MSRNPGPEVDRCRRATGSARAASRSAQDASCGAWLRNATIRSCCSASIVRGRAPTARTSARTARVVRASTAGTIHQTAPSNSLADDAPKPRFSVPAITCPPTKPVRRSRRASRTIGPLTLPTSVTTSPGRQTRASRRRSVLLVAGRSGEKDDVARRRALDRGHGPGHRARFPGRAPHAGPIDAQHLVPGHGECAGGESPRRAQARRRPPWVRGRSFFTQDREPADRARAA